MAKPPKKKRQPTTGIWRRIRLEEPGPRRIDYAAPIDHDYAAECQHDCCRQQEGNIGRVAAIVWLR